jgi:hypothetical protein
MCVCMYVEWRVVRVGGPHELERQETLLEGSVLLQKRVLNTSKKLCKQSSVCFCFSRLLVC